MLRLSSRHKVRISHLNKSRASHDLGAAERDDLQDLARAGLVRRIASGGGNERDVDALGMQLRTKGFVILREKLPRFWLRQASQRAGVALQKAEASENGYYDVEIEHGGLSGTNPLDVAVQETWESIISACRPARDEGSGMWCLHTHGLLATTHSAEAPWPKRPAFSTAAENAACLLSGRKPHCGMDCIHVIIPLAAMKAQIGAVGAAALDLRIGEILVIDDSHPHLGFGRSTKKNPQPLLYWTYAHRSSLALAWETQIHSGDNLNEVSPERMEELATERHSISWLTKAVPTSCKISFSKLQAERGGHGVHFSHLDNMEEDQIVEEPRPLTPVRAAQNIGKWIQEDTPDERGPKSHISFKKVTTSQQTALHFLSSMFKKYGQAAKSKKGKKNDVVVFQHVTPA